MSYEGGGDSSAWSTFPATQDVNIAGYNLNDPLQITGLGGLMSTLTVSEIDSEQVLTLNGVPVGGGAQGPTGETGPTPWTLPAAVYDNGEDYELGAAVTYLGGYYYRTGGALNAGYAPVPGTITEYWTPVADGGAQGPTGTFEFSGPTGAVLYYDGSGVTGNDGFLWTETGGMGNAYRLTGGLNGNCIDLDADANMSINLGLQDNEKAITINASSSSISLQDRSSGQMDSQIGITSDELVLSINAYNGAPGEYLGSDGNGKVIWSTPQGGLQYAFTGTSVGGTYSSYPTGTTFPAGSNLMSGITFTVPPNWSANNSVSWDGWALYDFSASNVNYWSVYYTTTSQPVEQALLGTTFTANSIYNSSSSMYLPMNLIIPPTHLEAAPTGTINLRIYGYMNSTSVTLSTPPVINGRVSVALN
jgi:hypothetical protein